MASWFFALTKACPLPVLHPFRLLDNIYLVECAVSITRIPDGFQLLFIPVHRHGVQSSYCSIVWAIFSSRLLMLAYRHQDNRGFCVYKNYCVFAERIFEPLPLATKMARLIRFERIIKDS